MKPILFTLFIFFTGIIYSQELDISVIVKSPANLKVDPAIYRSLEKDINDFINKTKWTDHDYEQNEKIKGKLSINIVEELNNNTFLAEFSLQTSRPVYNTDYTTPMINFLDKAVTISYLPGQVIQKNDKSFTDNLSACLTFYSMLILGFDYDSFQLYGGEDYFQLARETFNNLPNSLKRDDPSWSNQGVNGRSKYWIIENMLSPRVRPFRQILYEYHRVGLDNIYSDADKGRAVILSSLGLIEEVSQGYPNNYALQLFSDTKHNEIVEIFKPGDAGQRNKVRALMALSSQGNANRFDSLK